MPDHPEYKSGLGARRETFALVGLLFLLLAMLIALIWGVSYAIGFLVKAAMASQPWRI